MTAEIADAHFFVSRLAALRIGGIDGRPVGMFMLDRDRVAGDAAPIIAYLNKALNDVVRSQDFRSRAAALSMTVPAEAHARRSRRLYAPQDQAPWRIGSLHRHQDDGASAVLTFALTLLRRPDENSVFDLPQVLRLKLRLRMAACECGASR